MKRDPTVPLSLALLIGCWLIGLALGMPSGVSVDDPLGVQILFWVMFVSGIRATILWFQTLAHGVKHAAEENRVAVVFAHLFLGPIMAYCYYFANPEEEAQVPAESNPPGGSPSASN